MHLTPCWLCLLVADWGDQVQRLDVLLFVCNSLVIGLSIGGGRRGYVGSLVSELSLVGVHSQAKL